MANDLFGGLGGLMKGLSGFMPQDDPNVKLLNLQTEVNDLKNQEEELYAQIGRQAIQQYGASAFAGQSERLQLVRGNLAAAEARLKAATDEKAAQDAAERAADEQATCSSCGTRNPDGVKFCQECGAKLGPARTACPRCGTENAAGARFCGGCGNKLAD